MRIYAGLVAISGLYLSAASGSAQTATEPLVSTFSYSGAPIGIPTANTGVSAVAQIYVPNNESVTTVTAQVQINYPNIADLQVYLFSAQGTRTILLQNNCNNLTNINTTFDDSAQTTFSSFCPAEAGRGPFKPNQPLANSKGEDAAGYWNLVVTNAKNNSSTGTIQSFSLTITGNVITTPTFVGDSIVNSASMVGGLIVPGEVASIYGYSLGTQSGIAGGSTPATTLGGTTVSINGTLAPILYASYNQINFQVPYNLAPGSTAQIQVQTSSGGSPMVNIPVLASAAGLFTNQSNGRGQVLAINQDGTVNSSSNPAPAGTYVSLYADGLGALNQSVTTGMPAPNAPLYSVSGAVTVVIGGLTAPVQFAGLAPGYVGLYQINVQIPSTATSGRQGVFVVLANGISSQPGVYLTVQ